MEKHPERKKPPKRSRNLITDIGFFLFNRVKPSTLVKFRSEEDRDNYNKRILQRLGIPPDDFTILNLHHIGVDAPAGYVFNELLKWNGDSTCWPNYLARIDRIENDLEHIRILPFGWQKYPFGMKSLLGMKIIPLFLLNAIRFKTVPDCFDFDNARYLLYRCSGGYPIGFFSMYVRTSIPELGEIEPTQLFIIVGFNFYGKKNLGRKGLINKIWQGVHNRVTSNVLLRLKILCEWRLEMIQKEVKRREDVQEVPI